MDAAYDGIGRRKRLNPVCTGKRVTLQQRDLLWLRKLNEHGPLPSSFLLEFAKNTHRSEKRARERLTDLFNEANTPHIGPYLTRPPQQFRTIDSRYNQLVHDLSPAALSALRERGLPIRARSGPWLHSFMVSCITASIELACLDRDDIAYIPQSAILSRAGTELRQSVRIVEPKSGMTSTKDLLPDALFGLEYFAEGGSRFRFFAIEADRATEPATSANWNRKSFQRHLLQYQAYIERREYREHLNLSAPMLVLNVTSDARRMERMLKVTRELFPRGNSYQLFQTWDDFGPVFKSPKPKSALLDAPWQRYGMLELDISRLSTA